jgi:hypothetical protein
MILLAVPCVSTVLDADTGQIERQLTGRRAYHARAQTKLGSLDANLTCKVPHRTFANVQILPMSDLLPSSNSQLAHAKEISTDANALSGVGDFFDDDLRKVTAARFSERQC